MGSGMLSLRVYALNDLPRRVVDSLPSGMEERSIDVDPRGDHVREMVTQKACEISRTEKYGDPFSKQKIVSENLIILSKKKHRNPRKVQRSKACWEPAQLVLHAEI